MKSRRLEPNDVLVAEALRVFADGETFAALTALAEASLATPIRINTFMEGLTAILGQTGGVAFFKRLSRFDSAAIFELAEQYGLERAARRNLSLYMARWAPVLERAINGDRLRGCQASTIIDDEGDFDFELRLVKVDGNEISARLNSLVALDIVGKLLGCLLMANAGLPPEIDKNLVAKLRIGGQEPTGGESGE